MNLLRKGRIGPPHASPRRTVSGIVFGLAYLWSDRAGTGSGLSSHDHRRGVS
jgi:hypothetical protein